MDVDLATGVVVIQIESEQDEGGLSQRTIIPQGSTGEAQVTLADDSVLGWDGGTCRTL